MKRSSGSCCACCDNREFPENFPLEPCFHNQGRAHVEPITDVPGEWSGVLNDERRGGAERDPVEWNEALDDADDPPRRDGVMNEETEAKEKALESIESSVPRYRVAKGKVADAEAAQHVIENFW